MIMKSLLFVIGIVTFAMSLNTALSQSRSSKVQLISDSDFATIGLRGTNVNDPNVISILYPFGQGNAMYSAFSWTLAQWGSRFNLVGTLPVLRGDTVVYADSGKSVGFLKDSGNTQVDMEVFGSHEYLSPRQANQTWPNLYFGQTFENPLKLSRIDTLIFRIEARLKFSVNKMDSSTYNPTLHTAQFQIFLTIQNLNPNSSDYGDYLWFGLPLYDYRYSVIPAYASQDFGPNSTGKFIYDLASYDLYTGNFSDGNWRNISKDLYPQILQAFQMAQAKGYLKGSSVDDMHIASINIGWEIPGTFDCGAEFRNLELTAVTTEPSYINQHPLQMLTSTNFTLSQNFPNPFNPSTQITYEVPKTGTVTLMVFNVLGERVATLIDQEQRPGKYSVDFDGRALPSGVYFYTLRQGSQSLTKKMLLAK